jgi:hypothetical protein
MASGVGPYALPEIGSVAAVLEATISVSIPLAPIDIGVGTLVSNAETLNGSCSSFFCGRSRLAGQRLGDTLVVGVVATVPVILTLATGCGDAIAPAVIDHGGELSVRTSWWLVLTVELPRVAVETLVTRPRVSVRSIRTIDGGLESGAVTSAEGNDVFRAGVQAGCGGLVAETLPSVPAECPGARVVVAIPGAGYLGRAHDTDLVIASAARCSCG